jgi:hypothetical protein
MGEAGIAKAFDRATYGRDSGTVGGVVVRDGRIVAERYPDGFGPFVSTCTWSVGKSFAGAIAGNRTDALYFGGTAVTEQTTGGPLEAMPGTRAAFAADVAAALQ